MMPMQINEVMPIQIATLPPPDRVKDIPPQEPLVYKWTTLEGARKVKYSSTNVLQHNFLPSLLWKIQQLQNFRVFEETSESSPYSNSSSSWSTNTSNLFRIL